MFEKTTPEINESPKKLLADIAHCEQPFDEIDFNTKRYEVICNQYNEAFLGFKGLPSRYLRKWMTWLGLEIFKNKTPEDIMLAEADRENDDFDRRQTPEFKEVWGDPLQEVIKELKEKRDNPESNDIRPVLLVQGGGMESSLSTATLLAFHRMGITADLFEAIIGQSGGSGPAAFYTTGDEKQILEAAYLFANECTTKKFLNLLRISQIIDTTIISDRMTNGPNALNREAILNSSTDLLVTATNVDTNKVELLDMKGTETDMQEYLKATSALPICKNAEVEIQGNKYLDGAIGKYPFEEIMMRYKPTSILIIVNTPYKPQSLEQLPFFDAIKWGIQKMGSVGSLGSMTKVGNMLEMQESIKMFFEEVRKKTGVKIAIQWSPDTGLNPLSNDQRLVQSAIYEAYQRTLRDWGEDPNNYENIGSLIRNENNQ